MRKLLIVLVILVLLGGAVFYFGWVQFQIPPNSYAVIFSKTGGWEPDPISAGTFTWRWERLLPTNLTLYVYPLEPQQIRVETEGDLPSGDVYAGAIGASVDFRYRVEADVRYTVRPESLPTIAQEGVAPADLPEWYSGFETSVRETVVEAFGDALSGRGETPSPASLQENARSRLESRFPELEVTAVSPRSTSFPDYDLYVRAKEVYLGSLQAYEEGVAEAERQAAFSATQQERRIELLREYGKILSEYPVLLDYFTMSAERGIDPLQLEALRSAAEEGQ